MTFSKEHQKATLAASITLLVILNGYHFITRDEPKTAPLAYPRGSVASAPVRQGLQARAGGTDLLSLIIERQRQPYPGMSRDIFRMERPAARPVTRPVPTVMASPLPPPPLERTPEEIAADSARADLAKFRYLGYLTEKDNTLFLSKDGELFIVKIGEKVQNTYKVKDANKDAVVLLDAATGVERRIEMAGDGAQQTTQPRPPQPAYVRPPQGAQQQMPAQPRPQSQSMGSQAQQPNPQQMQPPAQQPAVNPASRTFQQRRYYRNLRTQDQTPSQ